MPPSLQIEPIVVSPFEENCYLVWNADTKRGVIVDPGDEGDRIICRVKKIGFSPEAILITHGHGDHIGAIAQVKDEFKIPVYCGDGEEELLVDPTKNLTAWYGNPIAAPAPDFLVSEANGIEIAGFTFVILSTPGHSPASVSYLCGKTLFSGDVLFMGSIGRVDLLGADEAVMMRTLRDKILTLADDVTVYPGHGPVTTIGRERQTNPFLLGIRAAGATNASGGAIRRV